MSVFRFVRRLIGCTHEATYRQRDAAGVLHVFCVDCHADRGVLITRTAAERAEAERSRQTAADRLVAVPAHPSLTLLRKDGSHG